METEEWYRYSFSEVLDKLEATGEGLSSVAAKERLLKEGANQLQSSDDPSLWILFFRQFLTTFVLILAIAVVVKFWTENVLDAFVLLFTIFLMVVIGFFQEMKAEKALRALKQLSAHKSKVWRDGKLQVIPSEFLVPGDLISLEVGDTVPADARLVESTHLKMQESMLTGESVPVEKSVEALKESAVLADRTNMVYTGTIVVYGKGRAVVTATGMRSALGEIAETIEKIEEEKTPLQKNIQSIGRWMLLSIFFAVLCFGIISIYHGISLLDVLLLTVAAIVSAIPEGLPVAFTVIFASGMRTMAKRNAIMRKLAAVETLGSTTIICSDKTGTLTLNQMTVQAFGGYDGLLSDPKHPVLRKMLEIGVLCNDARIIDGQVIGDPTEGALLFAADAFHINRQDLITKAPKIDEIPFLSENLYMLTAHSVEGQKKVYVKGAPEKILQLSNSVMTLEGQVPLDDQVRGKLTAIMDEMSRKALRLLAVGYCDVSSENLQDFEGKLHFVGIFGMIDPPRKEVAEAISHCQTAGIRVVMITGDNKYTASAIAESLQIPTQGVATGKDLEEMNEETFYEALKKISIFARVEPKHKLRIVQGFQKLGAIVAMTGDGVNDAPALESANIGISMGIAGTDVARQASDMVLADDRFDSIVAAIEEGRAIYKRLQNVCVFLMTTCFGELFGLILSVALIGVAPLLPLQILWLNLVSGSVIAIPLGLEPKDGNEMKAPPRDPGAHLIHRGMMYRILFLAFPLGLGLLCMLYYEYHVQDLEKARTMALSSVIIFEWLLGLQMRSDEFSLRKIGFFTNSALLGAICISLFSHMAILYIPILSGLFDVVPLSIKDWGVCLIPGAIIFLLEEMRKQFFPKLFCDKNYSCNK